MNKHRLPYASVENNFQVLPKFSAFFVLLIGDFIDIALGRAAIEEISSENHIKYSSCTYKTVHVYEQTKTNLHFC